MSEPVTNPPARRWLGPAFLVSLGINLFLAGMIATSAYSHRGGPHSERGGGPMSAMFGDVRGAKSDMSEEDRKVMRDIMVGQFKIIRPYLVEMDKSRKDLAAIIGASPYDAAKVKAGFERIDAARSNVANVMSEAMIKGFGEMSDEQRQRLATIMAKNAERHWRHGGKGPDEGPDGADFPPPPPDGPPVY
ncbi:MAG: periplasmic heavy metal sensor [Parvibaculum sp.]|nr:periplasmic heavy metal sensor [Parvibaculum sp.]|tara:strand:- start:4194 stop:4763 length:570 start_codon:yes stop_codon:yes gene_type:complete